MTTPAQRDKPLAEPGKQSSSGNTGGVGPQATPAHVARPADRIDAVDADAGRKDDDEDEWRHPPVAPVDEANPVKSLGKAIGDVVTGSERATPERPKR